MNPKPHEPEVNDLFGCVILIISQWLQILQQLRLIILAIDRGDLDWREMYQYNSSKLITEM